MMTPFSGLSLIVHLVVIGVGKLVILYKRFPKTNIYAKPRLKFQGSKLALFLGFKSVVSIIIVVSLTTLMLTSFGVAIQTGVREGSRESQRQYIQEVYEDTIYYINHL